MNRRTKSICLVLCIIAELFCLVSLALSNEPNRIVWTADDILSKWTCRNVTTTPDKSIVPTYYHKNINACLDATTFVHDKDKRGGITGCGSNARDAAKIIDGDQNTFWEPSQNDNVLVDWWVDIDLGRLVVATKLVLRFASEGQGDPFYKFRVLTSNGSMGSPGEAGAHLLNWSVAGEVLEPNRDQRVFECSLKPPGKWWGAPEWEGDAIQYVRIMVSDSRGGKAEEVTKERYDALPSAWQGKVEYYRITATGKEEEISKEGYEKLSQQERGTIKYYRRELPRLCEVEVWSVGEDITFGIIERGGSVDTGSKILGGNGSLVVDGSYLTYAVAMYGAYNQYTYTTKGEISSVTQLEWQTGMTIDFGARFWLDEVRIITAATDLMNRGRDESLLYSWRLSLSDGSVDENGNLVWEKIVEPYYPGDMDFPVSRLSYPFWLVSRSSPRRVRFLNFVPCSLPYKTRWNTELDAKGKEFVSEIGVYGEGYCPEAILLSSFLELPKGLVVTSFDWQGGIPASTRIEVRTRTGDSLKEIKHFYDKNGGEVTEYRYSILPSFMKGQVKTELVAGSDWSSWSNASTKSGDRIQSPSRKRYIQLQVKLLSDDPNQAPTLKSITINYQTALVNSVKVEIEPNHLEKGAGKPIEVSLTIKPSFVPEDVGFDKIMVVNPFKWVRDTRFRLSRLYKGETELSEGSDYRQVPTQDDTLLFTFPKIFKKGDVDSLEVRFTTELYWQTQVFDVYLGNSSMPGVWQSCEPGNTELTTGEIGIYGPNWKNLYNVEVEPKVFTPNGDGINDVVEVRFCVTLLWGRGGVVMEVYDKVGRRLRRYREERPKDAAYGFSGASGSYKLHWDGKDESGRKVSPGLYVVKVSVEGTGAVELRTVGVAY